MLTEQQRQHLQALQTKARLNGKAERSNIVPHPASFPPIELGSKTAPTRIEINTGDKKPSDEPRYPTMPEIIQAVSDFYLVPVISIKSQRRDAASVRARQVAVYLATKLTLLSYPMIARFIKHDYSTCIYGQQRVTAKMKTDPALDHSVRQLLAMLEPKNV